MVFSHKVFKFSIRTTAWSMTMVKRTRGRVRKMRRMSSRGTVTTSREIALYYRIVVICIATMDSFVSS